jgi:hypothetical protein
MRQRKSPTWSSLALLVAQGSDDAQCQTVWKMAPPNGATISMDQAVPYIVNFQMVDVDGDGKITADKFK